MSSSQRRALSSVAAAALLVPLGAATWSAQGTDTASNSQHKVTPRSHRSDGAILSARCRLPGPYELPHGNSRVDLDPADFTIRSTNEYWPMKPGMTWTYRESDASSKQRVRVTVTSRTRVVRGITARVVHDVARDRGQLVEDTYDWYAQDRGGTIWYLGEKTTEYEDGVPVSTAGSWEYGVDDAQAGVVIPANPKPGCRYRQEYYSGEAEDRGAILSTRESIQVPWGYFKAVLTTADTTPLEPRMLEHKFYAKDVGLVLAVGVSPHGSREELIDFDRSRRGDR